MELYFRHPGKLRSEYTKTENKLFAICHYQPGPAIQGMCWEYDIIQKINRNEEGYFDFSKNLIDIGSEDGGYAIYCNFNKNYCFEPNRQMCCLIWTNKRRLPSPDETARPPHRLRRDRRPCRERASSARRRAAGKARRRGGAGCRRPTLHS